MLSDYIHPPAHLNGMTLQKSRSVLLYHNEQNQDSFGTVKKPATDVLLPKPLEQIQKQKRKQKQQPYVSKTEDQLAGILARQSREGRTLTCLVYPCFSLFLMFCFEAAVCVSANIWNSRLAFEAPDGAA